VSSVWQATGTVTFESSSFSSSSSLADSSSFLAESFLGAQAKSRGPRAPSPPPPVAAPEGVKTTINLIVAQMVVSTAVAADDFQWQLENSPAGVLILLMDTIKTTEKTALREAQEKRLQFIRHLFQKEDLWVARISKARLGHSFTGRAESRASESWECRGLATTGTLARSFIWRRVPEAQNRSCGWRVLQGQAELTTERALASRFPLQGSRKQCVRRGCGSWAASSSARPSRRQNWAAAAAHWLPVHSRRSSRRRISGGRSTSSTRPSSSSFGGANCRMALPEDQPERPRWLFGGFGGETSALVRCTREVKDMPKWKQDAATFNEDLPFLGDVKQKVTNMQWWRPWTHQLLLYVGTARQGKGARQRQNKKAHVARRGKGKGQGKHRLR